MCNYYTLPIFDIILINHSYIVQESIGICKYVQRILFKYLSILSDTLNVQCTLKYKL
jgi:hypothetical protein